jgi:hypothetical protein
MDIVKAFEEIRDVPYRIPLALDESDDCCSGKANRFMMILKEKRYDVRYRVCSFFWSDLNLPEDLQSIPHEDACTHVYLEVKIGNDWRVVDPTWDVGLKGLFPIAEWDGVGDTGIGLPVRSIFSPEESLKILIDSNIEKEVCKDMKVNGKFYGAFNKWLEEYRKEK